MILCDNGHVVIAECKDGGDVLADMTCVIRGCVEMLMKHGITPKEIPEVLAVCTSTALELTIKEGEQP